MFVQVLYSFVSGFSGLCEISKINSVEAEKTSHELQGRGRNSEPVTCRSVEKNTDVRLIVLSILIKLSQ